MRLRRSTRLRTVKYEDVEDLVADAKLPADIVIVESDKLIEEISKSSEDALRGVPETDSGTSKKRSRSSLHHPKSMKPKLVSKESQQKIFFKVPLPSYKPKKMHRQINLDVEFAKRFRSVIDSQCSIFFDSLKKPDYASYQNLDVFKHPDDKDNLEFILDQLTELIPDFAEKNETDLQKLLKEVQDSYNKEPSSNDGKPDEKFNASLTSLLDEYPESRFDHWNYDESKLIKNIANMHSIDLTDISEILSNSLKRSNKRLINVNSQTKRSDTSIISNKCTKLLIRERDHSIPWPTKKRKADENDPNENIPLMS